jgi:hypothetical protein
MKCDRSQHASSSYTVCVCSPYSIFSLLNTFILFYLLILEMMMKKTSWPMLLVLLLLCLMKDCSVIGQSDPSSNRQTDGSSTADGSWWRTTPFASLPGLTTQQVLRSILPPDVIPYTPVSSPEETAGYIRDYVSTFKMQSRGMEHLHTYTNMFMALIMPKHLVPPGKSLLGNFIFM